MIIALAAAVVGYWLNQLRPEAEVKEAVRQLLTDPESAQFRDMERNSKTGAWCGTVNSKNRLGGYVGFNRFVVLPDKKVLLDPKELPIPEKSSDIVVRGAEIVDFIQLLKVHCQKLYAQ
ncbi:hypothetical protein [Rubrivivax gelatinosus]|uniref:hypothetical protein n=1 Tax=Rubrivivax gelatinosus TaxID=28068 RepID=UPI0011D2BD51|nr:hypothetical protein [Rubrivivax gelatinosus]